MFTSRSNAYNSNNSLDHVLMNFPVDHVAHNVLSLNLSKDKGTTHPDHITKFGDPAKRSDVAEPDSNGGLTEADDAETDHELSPKTL